MTKEINLANPERVGIPCGRLSAVEELEHARQAEQAVDAHDDGAWHVGQAGCGRPPHVEQISGEQRHQVPAPRHRAQVVAAQAGHGAHHQPLLQVTCRSSEEHTAATVKIHKILKYHDFATLSKSLFILTY